MTNKITEILKRGLKETIYPGAVLLIAREQNIVFFYSIGNRTICPQSLPMEKETRFDLASLTKPLATTLAAMKLKEDNLLDLNEPISSIIEPFPWKDKADITPRLLLNHSSGLPDWKPYYLELIKLPLKERKPLVRHLIMEEPLMQDPQTVSLYSDLGFIVLEWIVELLTSKDLSSFLNETFYQPLRLKTMHMDNITLEPMNEKELYAATEHCPWRKEIMQGHVHDENAYALGGYSGHAGLFGTAYDIFTLTTELVNIYHGSNSSLLKSKSVTTFLSQQEIIPGSTWALGWDTPSKNNSSSGNYFSSNSIGHTGFTGTSIWIDLEKRITVIFLTNRIHPNRSNEKIKEFRPELHNLIMNELGYGL
jgi:CubicO group peptidase (beta-lactamase class C family)